ncbi:hypothetical protein P3T21_005612 [Paraburkholderia sp. GAS334]
MDQSASNLTGSYRAETHEKHLQTSNSNPARKFDFTRANRLYSEVSAIAGTTATWTTSLAYSFFASPLGRQPLVHSTDPLHMPLPTLTDRASEQGGSR